MPTITDRQRLMQIRLHLIVAREEAGYSQGQAAKCIGIHRPTLSLVESGGQKLTVDMLLALCDLYRVEPAWILREDRRV